MRGHDFDAIRAQFPLLDQVRRDVKLTRAGGEWRGCCPFHQEQTPSFFVNEAKAFFHCFGCGAHGDVIDYVARVGSMEASEAISSLTGGKHVSLSDEAREDRRKWLEARDAEQKARHEAGTKIAKQKWDRARSVEGENAYLEAKGVAPHGTKTDGRNLLVPMFDASGEIINLQSIPPEPGSTKLFESAPTKGARFYIGIGWDEATIICEGFATGATIWEATVKPVCVAFSQGNIETIAAEYQAAGRKIIIGSDGKAEAAMRELAKRLDCPIVVPPALSKGDDFNDQMKEQGLEAVSETFRTQLLEWANRPPPPPEAPYCSIPFVDAFDFDEENIPPRSWLVPGVLLSGYTHILAAPGGTGKSLFTLQFAIALANGERWGSWQPRRQCRVLIINAEDDIDEQRRRLAAAVSVMGVDRKTLAGRVLIADNPSSIMVAQQDGKQKTVSTPLVEELAAVIRHHEIDVIIVDPLAETFEGEENSNDDVKWAMKIWRDQIARATGAAVYLVHHTGKGSGDKAGSADAIRGASALVNSARLASTLFVMTPDEASALGVEEQGRFRYVRYDDAKSNNSLIGNRQWFEKISVVLCNGPDGSSDGGDEVGALRPHSFSVVDELTYDDVQRLLAAVQEGYVDEDGVCTGESFTPSKIGRSKRWIGYLIMSMLDVTEERAKELVTRLKACGALVAEKVENPMKGREEFTVAVYPDRYPKA